MKNILEFNSKKISLKRYPTTEDVSLRAWSSAELLVADYIADKKTIKLHLYNDRFGVWNCLLNDKKLTTIWTYASQQKAIQQNLLQNNFVTEVDFKTPLDDLEQVELALVKVPKSIELFEFFLQQIHKSSTKKTEVVCGFMTKYFATSMVKIASKYFEEVTQSKAWKKARLLILKSPKRTIDYEELINTISWKEYGLHQYYGVFSSDKIDIGTQFLLQHLEVKETELNVLDVASGNGIIAHEVTQQNSKASVTLVDDFNLAIDSSKLNISNKKAIFICAENLDILPKNKFDLVVSNPPFHFEHENNIEVALNLFKGVQNCLKNNGRFVLVANKHLNYKTHLAKLFGKVNVVVEDRRFQVLECV